MSRWRWITVAISIVGIVGVTIVSELIDTARPGYLLLCSLPFLVGAAATLFPVQARNRIVLLWGTAALCGMVAVLTIMSGAGVVLLVGMVFYLVTAWNMNESTSRPAR